MTTLIMVHQFYKINGKPTLSRMIEKYPYNECPFEWRDQGEILGYLINKYRRRAIIQVQNGGAPLCFQVKRAGRLKGDKPGILFTLFPVNPHDPEDKLDIAEFGRLEPGLTIADIYAGKKE